MADDERAPDPEPEPVDGSTDEPVDEPVEPHEEPHEEPPARRRYPSTWGGAFYLLILAAVGVALWIVWRDDWRVGVRVLGATLGAAAVLRLVLPVREAGMLAVRHRLLDVVVLAGVGATLFFLAGDIPDQPL